MPINMTPPALSATERKQFGDIERALFNKGNSATKAKVVAGLMVEGNRVDFQYFNNPAIQHDLVEFSNIFQPSSMIGVSTDTGWALYDIQDKSVRNKKIYEHFTRKRKFSEVAIKIQNEQIFVVDVDSHNGEFIDAEFYVYYFRKIMGIDPVIYFTKKSRNGQIRGLHMYYYVAEGLNNTVRSALEKILRKYVGKNLDVSRTNRIIRLPLGRKYLHYTLNGVEKSVHEKNYFAPINGIGTLVNPFLHTKASRFNNKFYHELLRAVDNPIAYNYLGYFSGGSRVRVGEDTECSISTDREAIEGFYYGAGERNEMWPKIINSGIRRGLNDEQIKAELRYYNKGSQDMNNVARINRKMDSAINYYRRGFKSTFKRNTNKSFRDKQIDLTYLSYDTLAPVYVKPEIDHDALVEMYDSLRFKPSGKKVRENNIQALEKFVVALFNKLQYNIASDRKYSTKNFSSFNDPFVVALGKDYMTELYKLINEKFTGTGAGFLRDALPYFEKKGFLNVVASKDGREYSYNGKLHGGYNFVKHYNIAPLSVIVTNLPELYTLKDYLTTDVAKVDEIFSLVESNPLVNFNSFEYNRIQTSIEHFSQEIQYPRNILEIPAYSDFTIERDGFYHVLDQKEQKEYEEFWNGS